jgi:hypothetical protein
VERKKDSPTKESNRYALYIAFFLSGAAALG